MRHGYYQHQTGQLPGGAWGQWGSVGGAIGQNPAPAAFTQWGQQGRGVLPLRGLGQPPASSSPSMVVVRPAVGAVGYTLASLSGAALGGAGRAGAGETPGVVDLSPPSEPFVLSLFDPRWVDVVESGLSEHALKVGLPAHVVRRSGSLTLTETT